MMSLTKKKIDISVAITTTPMRNLPKPDVDVVLFSSITLRFISIKLRIFEEIYYFTIFLGNICHADTFPAV